MSSQFSGGGGVLVSSPEEYPEYPQKTTLNLQDAPLLDVEGVVVDILVVLGIDESPDG